MEQLQQLRPQLQLQPLVVDAVVVVVVVVVVGRQMLPLMLPLLRLRVGARALIIAVGCCHSLVVGALTLMLLAVLTSAGCWLTLELHARKTRVAACQHSSILVGVTMMGLCRAA
jgi:hypothetical protein